jgi:hypothetical protein
MQLCPDKVVTEVNGERVYGLGYSDVMAKVNATKGQVLEARFASPPRARRFVTPNYSLFTYLDLLNPLALNALTHSCT